MRFQILTCDTKIDPWRHSQKLSIPRKVTVLLPAPELTNCARDPYQLGVHNYIYLVSGDAMVQVKSTRPDRSSSPDLRGLPFFCLGPAIKFGLGLLFPAGETEDTKVGTGADQFFAKRTELKIASKILTQLAWEAQVDLCLNKPNQVLLATVSYLACVVERLRAERLAQAFNS